MCASLNTAGDQEMSALQDMEKEDGHSADLRLRLSYALTTVPYFRSAKNTLELDYVHVHYMSTHTKPMTFNTAKQGHK